MNKLEIKHLRLICAIADTGNMTRAAERLYLSQSALSQQLKDIEEKLGVELFLRVRKKMVLARTGQSLLPAARRIIADIESAELDIASHLTGEKGELKVGTQCIFCYKWLPRVLSALQEKFPRVDLSVGNCSDTGADLDDAKFDVVISGAAAREDKYTSVALFADHMVCVMHSDHELASRNYVDYADFNDFNLITHAEKAKNRFYLAFLQKRGVEPQKVMAVGAPQAILEMVVAGFGIAIFPKWAIAGFSELYPLVYKPISAKGHPMTWHAIYPQQAYQPLFLTEFLRIVRMAALVEPSTAK